MKRLVFVAGMCQLVNAATALRQHCGKGGDVAEDDLVLFLRNESSRSGQVIGSTAKCLWDWHQVHWVQDVLEGTDQLSTQAAVLASRLCKAIGTDVAEIWISKLASWPAKLFLYTYPGARVYLYEDGAEEYIPQTTTCGWRRLRELPRKHVAGGILRELSHAGHRPQCLNMDGVCERDLKRVETFYTFLGRHLQIPLYLSQTAIENVEQHHLRESYALIENNLATDTPIFPETLKPMVLFLPQAFATHYLSVEDEYRLFYQAVEIIVNKGYAVCWKDHPSEGTSRAKELQDQFGAESFVVLKVNPAIPVEVLVKHMQLHAVATVSSSSGLYLQDLYGVPCYTAAACLKRDLYRRRSGGELANLFSVALPSIDAMCDASEKIREL